MLKRLDTYVIRRFSLILGMALIGFTAVFIVVDLIENIDRFIDNDVPWKLVVMYYIYTLPWFVSIGFPMSTLIATVFSIGLMEKRNEFTAMKSSGISLYRLAAPLILMGFLLSGISYEFDNALVSWGNEKRYNIEREYLKRHTKRSVTKMRSILTDVFLQKQGSVHIAIAKYRSHQEVGEGVTVLVLKDEQLQRRTDAKRISWIDSLNTWAVADYSVRLFNQSGEEMDVIVSPKDTLMNLDFVPSDISKQFKSPDELNFNELTDRIALLKENGVNTTRWEVARYFKVSFSFTNLIVILFGLPLVVMKPKGGLSFGAGVSVFVIFAYYAFIKFGQSMGYKGILDPLSAAWIGNIVFLIGGIILLMAARK